MVDVFLDTDVAFDLISKREPFFTDALPLLQMAGRQQVQLQISEACLATLMYLSFDIYKLENAGGRLLHFVEACEVFSGGKSVFIQAIESEFTDKEDALQYYIALRHHSDYFLTRNTDDYKYALQRLPVFSPSGFIRIADF
ncbi:PIN domain-containing protein [Natronogracilivirga saccharolytica]|uniref:PIN domain-containing protein n=1 Tax=Natronogracilivirga saccharolytica TaxID=2812953 RepID=A0A8J7UUT4_9BACT|nr:PIN domain-containing protein [Natronogracilivirga saccharolytica]MBP3191852.1 PIN domain-containing protein [Natronogracilivirga saccharolytica]